jgi:hypothetical protein
MAPCGRGFGEVAAAWSAPCGCDFDEVDSDAVGSMRERRSKVEWWQEEARLNGVK